MHYFVLECSIIVNLKIKDMVPRAGIEPARIIHPRDFKSLASTNFATWAFVFDDFCFVYKKTKIGG
jgi:hypothetical protein